MGAYRAPPLGRSIFVELSGAPHHMPILHLIYTDIVTVQIGMTVYNLHNLLFRFGKFEKIINWIEIKIYYVYV